MSLRFQSEFQNHASSVMTPMNHSPVLRLGTNATLWQPICFKIAALAIGLSLLNIDQLAHANPPVFSIDLPVYGQPLYRDLITQAEDLVNREIGQQFRQNRSLTELQVVVLSNHNGNIIPLLRTTVSRNQWLANPQVRVWTRYYGEAYALLQPHALNESAASHTEASTTPSNSTNSQLLDEPIPTGAAAQDKLSQLD